MISRYYRIAGRVVKLCSETEEIFPDLEGFETEEDTKPEAAVELYRLRKRFQLWYGVEYCRADLEYPHLLMSRAHPRIRLTADAEWRDLTIEGAQYGTEGVMEVLLTAFYSRLSMTGYLLAHASCICWNGESIIFTASSGTGKTTQAELWKKYKNAEILNGDKVILECGGESCAAWGSPWKGSSPYAVNKKAPLRAVVVLSQGKENIIRRLEKEESMELFFPHIFYPSWDAACAGKAMESLDTLMRRVPVYHLSCLPDRGAVETACREIWGDDAR